MASTDEPLPPKAGPSLVVQLGVLLAMTVAAAGMGFLSGGYLNGDAAPAKPHAAATASGGHGESKAEEGHAAAPEAAAQTTISLAPITTNLASPDNVWVRMELAIVLDEPQGADLPDIIQQDLMAFVRTVKLHQIDGASGFQHFKADLEERASIRSNGHVKQILVRTLLFE